MSRSMSSPGFVRKTVSSEGELALQQQLIDSVNAEGGYGRKVSHPLKKGVSDLLIQVKGYSMVQIECKDLKQLSPGFNVLSGITDHQKEHVEALNEAAQGLVAFYCFFVNVGGNPRAFFIPHYVERVTYQDACDYPSIARAGASRNTYSWPGLSAVFHALGVMRSVENIIR